MIARPWLALAVAAALLSGAACRRREPPEAVRARANAAFLESQLASLEALVAKAEAGELKTRDHIAIGISEGVVKELLDASLPQETTVAGRLRVRIESGTPVFRGNKAFLVFRARMSSVRAPSAFASVELGGGLDEFRLKEGRLLAQVALGHFTVLETSVGDLAADVLDNLIRNNLEAIQGAIPNLEIPVSLEQTIEIGGLDEGAVRVKPGALPLQMAVAHVVPVNARLWVFIDAKAGPWQRKATAAE
ncbi:MAG TPA: hypothetical protein VFM88_02660 [Vicinamibacteria bacterium]|nr:hypothetical protein [Vicinamibacteria bacterium]